MQYRQHNQPGCGGCLFMVVLLILITGGLPLLFDILGVVFYIGLFTLFFIAAAFWGFSYFVKRQIANYEKSQTETHNRFVFLLVNILVNIAGIDGEVSRSELNAINNFFRTHLRYNQSQMFWVKELTKEAMTSTAKLEELLADFKTNFAYEPRLILVELIYQVIYSKPDVISAELNAAERIAVYLGLNAYQHQAIHNKYRGMSRGYAAGDERYYGVLGLKPDAGFDEIRKAYRKLSKEYHPDKVSHLGEEFRRVAEEKMKEINEAYNHLKKKFN
ncbi:MAG: DnaJ domain-containing protein [Desulfobulbaceae bacterium]|nr:DnaJ domain-containing protein [Desulfobulbaceae bacterium]